MVPSHQAPALLLKSWRPELFSGLGLVLGSMAPDLEFIFRIQSDWVVSHTLAAQIYFTAPLTVLLYWTCVELLLPWLVPFLPAGAPLHLDRLGRVGRPRRAWGVVAVSGTLGGLTHVFLDGFTHSGHSGWAAIFFPILLRAVPGLGFPLCDGLQAVLSIVLGFAALALWARFADGAGDGPAARVRSLEARARLAAVVLGTLVAGMLLARHLHPAAAGVQALELEAYGAADVTLLVLVAGASWDRLRAATPWTALPDGA